VAACGACRRPPLPGTDGRGAIARPPARDSPGAVKPPRPRSVKARPRTECASRGRHSSARCLFAPPPIRSPQIGANLGVKRSSAARSDSALLVAACNGATVAVRAALAAHTVAGRIETDVAGRTVQSSLRGDARRPTPWGLLPDARRFHPAESGTVPLCPTPLRRHRRGHRLRSQGQCRRGLTAHLEQGRVPVVCRPVQRAYGSIWPRLPIRAYR
jgi:hypothetical protein